MEVNIRKAVIQDAKVLDNLLTMLIQDEKNYDNNINENFVVNNFYKTKINQDKICMFVAESNNQIIGYIYGYILDNDAVCLNIGSKLDALYIIEEYRNLGIGKRLLEEFKKWSKDNNATYIEVNVLTKNINAYNLYKRANFKEVKTTLSFEIN